MEETKYDMYDIYGQKAEIGQMCLFSDRKDKGLRKGVILDIERTEVVIGKLPSMTKNRRPKTAFITECVKDANPELFIGL